MLPNDFGDEADIWLSDESFIWYFLLKQPDKLHNYDCNFNHQKILFLSEDDRPMPEGILKNYTEINRAGWFVIYRRNK